MNRSKSFVMSKKLTQQALTGDETVGTVRRAWVVAHGAAIKCAPIAAKSKSISNTSAP